MRRNKLLFILTILVVIIGILFLINRRYSTLDDAESGFAIEDTASVTKIFLVDKNNRSVLLVKEAPGKWKLMRTPDWSRRSLFPIEPPRPPALEPRTRSGVSVRRRPA